jgi:hypothetical protein
MSEKNWRILILLPWLALPLLVGCYAASWSRLPAEIAVQFSLSGKVTNSFGRTQTLLLNSAILLFVLARFTLKLWGAGKRGTRALMLTYYVAVVFITTIFLFILKFNLGRA